MESAGHVKLLPGVPGVITQPGTRGGSLVHAKTPTTRVASVQWRTC